MPVTVLIVDDHPSFRATARLLLESEGFEVVGEAADGASGLLAARELAPDSCCSTCSFPTSTASRSRPQLTGGGRRAGRRPDLEPRRGRLRPARGRERRARLRAQGRALGRGAAGPYGARVTAILEARMTVDLVVATPTFLDLTFVGLEGHARARARSDSPPTSCARRAAARSRPSVLRGSGSRRRSPRRSATTTRAISCARCLQRDGDRPARAAQPADADHGRDAGRGRPLDGHGRPGRAGERGRRRRPRAARGRAQPGSALLRAPGRRGVRDLRRRRRARVRPPAAGEARGRARPVREQARGAHADRGRRGRGRRGRARRAVPSASS